MPSVCFYFQVHQPFRIRPFSYFDHAVGHDYFDNDANRDICRKVAQKCYLPANELILRLIERHDGAFRVAYSVTGVAMEQFEMYSPETTESFKRLAQTGCVEFLGETYHHSLAAIFDEEEFRAQVKLHRDLMKSTLDYEPTTFRNTELIYDDRIGGIVENLGYCGIIAEGVDDVLDWRSPNYVYRVPGGNMAMLLKNYRLSDDIAFRFSNREWKEYPLTAEKFASWVHAINGSGQTVNLFMDYETFGEHQWEETGIMQFLEHVPEYLLRHPDWDFKTPTEVIAAYPPISELSFHRTTSWADVDRDLTAWRGNRMQDKALHAIYSLSRRVLDSGDASLIDAWRKLQTSDHFYYMCTKWFADGDVHAYFSPFESPYDAFVNYTNVLKDFERALDSEARRAAVDPAVTASP